ncbi:MAG: hypothetical protein QXK47_04585 [Candidatus Bathyarchaeia archaeon]
MAITPQEIQPLLEVDYEYICEKTASYSSEKENSESINKNLRGQVKTTEGVTVL